MYQWTGPRPRWVGGPSAEIVSHLLIMPGCPSATFLVQLKDGVAYENERQWGMGHLLEHLHFQGCAGYPDFAALTGAVEGLGGLISAYTTRRRVAYWVRVPLTEAAPAREILFDVLANDHFQVHHLAGERAIIGEEIARERASPGHWVSMALEEALLVPSLLARHPLGNRGVPVDLDIAAIENYKREVYTRGAIELVAAGDFSPQYREDLQADILRHFPPGPARDEIGIGEDLPRSGKPVLVECSGTGRAHLSLGWRIATDDAKVGSAFGVILAHLAGGFSSALY